MMTPLQKLTKNVRDSGKLIVAKGLLSFPKSNKLPNLATLLVSDRVKAVYENISTQNNLKNTF